MKTNTRNISKVEDFALPYSGRQAAPNDIYYAAALECERARSAYLAEQLAKEGCARRNYQVLALTTWIVLLILQFML